MGQPKMPKDMQILHRIDWKRDIRSHVAHRAGYRCQHCHAFVGMNGQADHIVPRRELAEQGGNPWATDNLQWLCIGCHSQKTNKERWGRYERQPRPAVHRRKIEGREAFLLAAGIPEPTTRPPAKPCKQLHKRK